MLVGAGAPLCSTADTDGERPVRMTLDREVAKKNTALPRAQTAVEVNRPPAGAAKRPLGAWVWTSSRTVVAARDGGAEAVVLLAALFAVETEAACASGLPAAISISPALVVERVARQRQQERPDGISP